VVIYRQAPVVSKEGFPEIHKCEKRLKNYKFVFSRAYPKSANTTGLNAHGCLSFSDKRVKLMPAFSVIPHGNGDYTKNQWSSPCGGAALLRGVRAFSGSTVSNTNGRRYAEGLKKVDFT